MATDLFYKSKTCRDLHDQATGLYLMGDIYSDNLLSE